MQKNQDKTVTATYWHSLRLKPYLNNNNQYYDSDIIELESISESSG